MEKFPRRRLRVADLHPHLMCILCGGYYVDATTIIECLHSFCKSCLVRYLETNKYCPICEVQVHKTKPLLNIRPDETLQNMVYKLVPGLFYREMRLRREFYAENPDAPPSGVEDRGIIDPIECQFYSPEEPVSLALEFNNDCSGSPSSSGVHTRYLRCPAAVTVGHLQKLVRNKFGLSPSQLVEVMFDGKFLTPDLSIVDVAYTFQRKRKEQFNLTYRIVERQSKRRRLEDPGKEENTEGKLEEGPPALLPAKSAQPMKHSGPTPPVPETKSKLDSIISRLGIAKKTENLVKKEKGTEEWKEVQLQISESGVMSVTDISSIDKLINTIEKSVGPTDSKESTSPSNPDLDKKDKLVTSGNKKVPEVFNTTVSLDLAGKKEAKVESLSLNCNPSKSDKTDGLSMGYNDFKEVKETKKEARKEERLDIDSKRSALPINLPSPSPSLKVHPAVCTTSQNIPEQKVIDCASVNSAQCKTLCNPVSPSISVSTAFVRPGASQSSQVNPSIPSCSVKSVTSVSSGTNVKQVALAVNKASGIALTTTTTARASPVPVTKPLTQPIVKKSSSSPVGYKTLKCGPKNWNPTISRNSFLSSKMEQQPQHQGSSTDPASTPTSSGKPVTPPRFFKMRNTPRYLGNPASGVKAMYQIPEGKPETSPQARSPSVMKLDPRTLTPIVSNASPTASKPPSSQPKGRPPFPSTTLSAQVTSNHLPSSRSVATTTSSPSSKHTDLSSLRNSAPPIVNPFLPFLPKGMPNFLFGGPGLLPSGAQFAGMLRPGLGFPQVTGSGFHPTLPQAASMLFNPHQLHRQLNSSSPSSPTGFPSSLPSSPSMSLSPSSTSSSSSSSSKNYASSSKNTSCSDKALSNSGNQLSSNRKTHGSMQLSTTFSQEEGKLNGTETLNNVSLNHGKSLLSTQEQRLEVKSRKSLSLCPEELKTVSPKITNNNNTLSLPKSKAPTSQVDEAKLPLDVSNLLSKESKKCTNDQIASKSKTPSSTSVQSH